jgi:ribonuclease III
MERQAADAHRTGKPRRVARTKQASPTPEAQAAPSPSHSEEALQAHLGYRFEDPSLLTLAVTHSSFVYEERLGRARANGDEPNEPGSDNEQLEFLGDAVLGLVVTELLLREFPERTEGELTRMRASLVSRKRMAELGEHLHLELALRLGKSAEAGESRQKMAVLANTAEAVLGAVYLDSRRTTDARARSGERALRTVREIVERLLVKPDLPSIHAALEAAPGRGALRDAKSRLQERVQAVSAGKLVYADIGETGPAHARRFSVEVRLEARDGRQRGLATGEGGTKKEAQQAAAGKALDRWAEIQLPEPVA